MKQDRKRQATESKSKRKAKKTQIVDDAQSSSSSDDPVLVQYIDYENTEVPSISLNPDLDTLLYPMKASTFLGHSLRQRAVHITCQKGFEEEHGNTRVGAICREMYNLDVRSILQETSSDSIFLWLRQRQGHDIDNPTNGNAKTGSKEDMIHSVEISDVETALALHKTAGHATYCRAPPKVEQNLVSSLLKATGLGCGQYDPSGESMIALARGEVETFISSPGHVTNWHFDFQENFTIQLSGIKRWTIQQGTIRDPIRGCTPHYAAPEAVESQLKAANLFDRKFRFGHPKTGVNATGKVVSIDVRPGDVFYFPAGMWHTVETIVPGVSINVSLMANNYATVVSQAIQHFLLQFPAWRQPVLHNNSSDVIQNLNGLLQELPTRLQQLSRAEFIIPPALQYPLAFHPIDDDDEDEEDNITNKNNAEDGDNQEIDESVNTDDDDDDDDDDEEEPTSIGTEESNEEDDEVLDPREFDYPNGWGDWGYESTEEVVFERNPLALLHKMEELTNFYNGKVKRNGTVFVLNVNFAGNNDMQSAVRVVFCDSPEGFVNRLYTELEGVVGVDISMEEDGHKASPSHEIRRIVSPRDWPFARFLIYHGYISCKEERGRDVEHEKHENYR